MDCFQLFILELLKVKPFWSLVCPPRTQSIWYLSHRLPSPSVLFVAPLMAAARSKGSEEVYTNEGNAAGAVCGFYLLCLLSQLEHLLWSVLSPSHPHKHCLTLVESAPLCWLNMSLCYRHSLDDIFFSFFFVTAFLFFLTHTLPCAP